MIVNLPPTVLSGIRLAAELTSSHFATQQPDVWANREPRGHFAVLGSLAATRYKSRSRREHLAPVETCTVSVFFRCRFFVFFYLSFGFWCWTRSSESQDSTSLREKTITQTSRRSPRKTPFRHLMGTRRTSASKHAVCLCFPHGQKGIISSQSPALFRNPTTRESIFGQAQARTDVMSLTGMLWYYVTRSRPRSVGVPVHQILILTLSFSFAFIWVRLLYPPLRNENSPDYWYLLQKLTMHNMFE